MPEKINKIVCFTDCMLWSSSNQILTFNVYFSPSLTNNNSTLQKYEHRDLCYKYFDLLDSTAVHTNEKICRFLWHGERCGDKFLIAMCLTWPLQQTATTKSTQ